MKKYVNSQISIAPLAVFRVLFGFIMLVSTIRFALRGWIYELYVAPQYYFTFYGFDWVKPLGEFGMYALFFVISLSALCIMLGYYYRVAAVLFFLAFTYVELIDKTNYLNHYYFVSIMSFLLIFVPANRSFSLDVIRKPSLKLQTVPAWTINILKLQLGIVYFYAGLAKLNSEWLVDAMPLKLWLPANAHLPIIGPLLEYTTTAYLFSWGGAFYDLTIVFFLLYKPTRVVAYAAVVIFHMLTLALFQIGMFPYIMILSTLIFFSAEFHQQLIDYSKKAWRKIKFWSSSLNGSNNAAGNSRWNLSKAASTTIAIILSLHFLIQALFPFRYALYPGNLFWNEQGYRFSWRVMLMEKAGSATFHIHNPETNKSWEVSNWEYLTKNQEKMMAKQPDMILQFAHYLEDQYRKQGMDDLEIRAESYVTLNGRKSSLLIDPEVDLTEINRGFEHKKWILPLSDSNEKWIQQDK